MKMYKVTRPITLTVEPGSTVIISEVQYWAAKAFLEAAEVEPEAEPPEAEKKAKTKKAGK